MNPIDLKQELYKLTRMLSDATIVYEDKLRESGQVELSNEWRYNLHDMLGDVPHLAEDLEDLYAAPRERIAFLMGEFLERAAGESAIFHPGGHMRRLNDILE